MRTLLIIVGVILNGLVVGALGRLAIPGPNPMSLVQTTLVGVGGSVLGAVVGGLLFGATGGLILAVLAAALIVWLVERRRKT